MKLTLRTLDKRIGRNGLISLKKSKTESYNLEELNDFKKVLDNIIEEIFDQSISFSENQP